jgi:hypothetical protein
VAGKRFVWPGFLNEGEHVADALSLPGKRGAARLAARSDSNELGSNMKIIKCATGALGVMILLTGSLTLNTFAQNLRFTSIQVMEGGAVSLRWQSQSNAIYRVDYAGDLSGWAAWKVLCDNYPSQNTNTMLMDAGNSNGTPAIVFPGNDPARFYRVVQTRTNDPAHSPQVNIIIPTNGAVLAGTAAVKVSVSSSQAVAGIRLFIDGAETGYNAPGQTNFAINTCPLFNGTHQLFAVAGDTNQNYGVSPVNMAVVSNLACGAHWYVRQGASGTNDGSDWNNAWSDVTNINWYAVYPGDTIWIAGGTYGSITIGASGQASARIFIKRVRATNSIPAGAAGWDNHYDSTVVINFVSCNTPGNGNYVTLDGQIPYGGMVVTNKSLGEDYAVNLNVSGASYFELLNLDIGGVSTLNTVFTGEGRCFSATTAAHGLHVAGCKLHGEPTLILTGNQEGMLWEHNFLYDSVVGNTANWHPNVWNSIGGDHNCVFRYNEISNYMVECFMFSEDANTNWQIYGNLIHDATPAQTSRLLEAQKTAHGPVLLFNNSFVNLYWGIRAVSDESGTGSWVGCVSSNNIFFNAGDPNYYGFFNGADDYLLTDASMAGVGGFGPHCIGGASTNIFVNYAGANYHIVTNLGPLFPRNQGATLAPQYSVDFDGRTRGADGAWDIGDFEAIGP